MDVCHCAKEQSGGFGPKFPNEAGAADPKPMPHSIPIPPFPLFFLPRSSPNEGSNPNHPKLFRTMPDKPESVGTARHPWFGPVLDPDFGCGASSAVGHLRTANPHVSAFSAPILRHQPKIFLSPPPPLPCLTAAISQSSHHRKDSPKSQAKSKQKRKCSGSDECKDTIGIESKPSCYVYVSRGQMNV